MEHPRVLVVDDDQTIRKMLSQYLGFRAYNVQTAASFPEAIELITEQSFDVVLSDVRMPGADGIQLLEWITMHRPETATIMLSGCDEARMAVHAMKAGALDYIVKPFDLGYVAKTLDRAIGKQKEAVARAEYLAKLEAALEQQAGALRGTIAQLQEASEGTLDALTAALDARERETQAHSKRVSEYSVHLARELGVAEADVDIIRQGSMLHDIGKIGIPDRILLKPDRLTPEEWVEMRKHPEIGAWIVNGVESLKGASDIVIAHHERYDGTGYPHGLRGDEIPLGARVFAVADTLDAMLSDRPYRIRQNHEQVRKEISGGARTQFDPFVANGFLRVPEEEWNAIRERSLNQNVRVERAG